MAKGGGDILEVSYKHPTLGQGVLAVKSDEDSELDLGGFRTADDEKSIASNGEDIPVMTRSRWSATFVMAPDFTTAADQQAVTDMAGNAVPAEWTITHITGAIYRGTGRPVGDVKAAFKAGTIQLKISGGSIAKLVS